MTQTTRRVEVIYCDDIREETGNKVSYMGIYGGELMVDSLPTVLPKLCAAVKVVTSTREPFQSLRIRVIREAGQERSELLDTGALQMPAHRTTPEPEDSPQVWQMAFVFASYRVENEQQWQVEVSSEGETLVSLPLRIHQKRSVLAAPAHRTLQ